MCVIYVTNNFRKFGHHLTDYNRNLVLRNVRLLRGKLYLLCSIHKKKKKKKKKKMMMMLMMMMKNKNKKKEGRRQAKTQQETNKM